MWRHCPRPYRKKLSLVNLVHYAAYVDILTLVEKWRRRGIVVVAKHSSNENTICIYTIKRNMDTKLQNSSALYGLSVKKCTKVMDFIPRYRISMFI